MALIESEDDLEDFPEDGPYAGLIPFEIFGIDVPVFLDNETRVAFLKQFGCAPFETDRKFYGMACRDWADGTPYFSMVITRAATQATWAHEAVHLVDFVLDTLQIPTGTRNSELKAYMVGFIMDELAAIFAELEPEEMDFEPTLGSPCRLN